MKTKNVEIKGVVVKVEPNANYRVKANVENKEFFVLCYLCGKMTKNFINPGVDDKVLFEMCPSDLKNTDKMKGRIIRRLK
jgi:translation initiation factor IF-1